MLSSLGLYIENNIIKYAKISRDHENIRIDSFGIKFYDNIDEAVKQVINETYSYKTPISINLSDEKYTYAQLFSLLNKKDLQKAADTEFEYFCSETGKNKNGIEYRTLLVEMPEDKDKLNGIYAYTDKSGIVGKLQTLDGFKVTSITPLPVSIANLNKFGDKSNNIIINIEKNTSITTIINGEIQRINIIEKGMKDIFENIIVKENSYAKAYEICKNSTIYTSQGRNLQIEENEYMEDIMPVLYQIIEETRDIIKLNGFDISNIYITGLAAAINNIDLYFQENFPDKKCEILAPFFINKSNVKLNIKDYIEVNSAIALALQGVGIGPKEINFKNSGKMDQISQLISIEIGGPKTKNNNSEKTTKVKKTPATPKISLSKFKSPLDGIEKGMLRFSIGILMLVIVYTAFGKILINNLNDKKKEMELSIENSKAQISDVIKKTQLVNKKTSQYNELLSKIEENTQNITQKLARKKAIPNLLNRIMSNIPKEVQLLTIKNPTTETVEIEAQSLEYEQLGYFVAKIKNEGILLNVTTSPSTKQNGYVVVTITGELPYVQNITD